jgi:hypothetical protein
MSSNKPRCNLQDDGEDAAVQRKREPSMQKLKVQDSVAKMTNESGGNSVASRPKSNQGQMVEDDDAATEKARKESAAIPQPGAFSVAGINHQDPAPSQESLNLENKRTSSSSQPDHDSHHNSEKAVTSKGGTEGVAIAPGVEEDNIVDLLSLSQDPGADKPPGSPRSNKGEGPRIDNTIVPVDSPDEIPGSLHKTEPRQMETDVEEGLPSTISVPILEAREVEPVDDADNEARLEARIRTEAEDITDELRDDSLRNAGKDDCLY